MVITPGAATTLLSYVDMVAVANVGCKYAISLQGGGSVTITSAASPGYQYLRYWAPNTIHDDHDQATITEFGTPDQLRAFIRSCLPHQYDSAW